MKTGFTGCTGWGKAGQAYPGLYPFHPGHRVRFLRWIGAELDALQAEVDTLKRLQAEAAVKNTGQAAAELDALLSAVIERAFKGGL